MVAIEAKISFFFGGGGGIIFFYLERTDVQFNTQPRTVRQSHIKCMQGLLSRAKARPLDVWITLVFL